MQKYLSEQASTHVLEAVPIYIGAAPKYNQLSLILGGANTLKNEITSDLDLIAIARAGLPKRTLNAIATKLNISMEKLSTLLHISHRTLQRKSASDHLSVHVSEQILSIAEVIRRGIEVLGDNRSLEVWLQEELTSLGDRKPIDLLDTTFGTQMVLRILGRIEHGVY
jgi:putative toxin-antitoxin system antitoxin component (TIGR02293 family)